jgi:conjugal transfer pilin signal peptidase TrbI
MIKANKNQKIIIGMLILNALISSRITVNYTKSLKHRVFWNSPYDPTKIVHGQYVRFNTSMDLPQASCDPCIIVKKVGCRAGDNLRSEGGGFYCNSAQICKALPGKETFEFNGMVPEGKVFLIGDSLDSYDSRYFGFVDEGDINAILRPLM